MDGYPILVWLKINSRIVVARSISDGDVNDPVGELSPGQLTVSQLDLI
jgi:hypothetical protein